MVKTSSGAKTSRVRSVRLFLLAFCLLLALWPAASFGGAWRTRASAEETGREVVEITESSLATDSVWETGKLYWVRQPLTVPAGRTLTIQDDVIVRFAPAAGFTVNGMLIAGLAAVPLAETIGITLTSEADDSVGGDIDSSPSSGAAGDWAGLTVNAGGLASLSDVRLSYAGAAGAAVTAFAPVTLRGAGVADSAGVGFRASAPVTVTNSLFASNVGAAIVVEGAYDLAVSELSASGNGVDGIVQTADMLTGTLTLQNGGIPHVLADSLMIDAVGGLVLDDGVVLQMPAGASLVVSGTLTANGTLADPVELDALSTAWGRVDVRSGGSISLTETTIRNGGVCNDCSGAVVEVAAGATAANLATVRFSGNSDVPIRAALTAPLSVSGLDVLDGRAAVQLHGTSLTVTRSLTAGGLPYWLEGDLTVGDGGSLTLEPGVTLALNTSGVLATTGSGRIAAIGTAATPITLTAINGTTAGSWGHLAFSGSGGGRLEHVTLQYGGYDVSPLYTETLTSGPIVSGTLRLLGGPVTVLTTTIVDGRGPAVTADAGMSLDFGGLVAERNSLNAVVLRNMTLSTATPITYTWTGAGIAYYLEEDLRLNSGVNLQLGEGTVIKLRSNGRLFVSGGRLLTNGDRDAGRPVVFTSRLDDSLGGDLDGNPSVAAAGDWGYLFLSTSAAESQFNGTDFRYGGGYVGTTALPGSVRLSGIAAPVFTDAVFEDNVGSAIRATGVNFPLVTGSAFVNNGLNGIEVAGGVFGDGTTTMRGVMASRDVTYTLTGNYTIAAKATLEISRGVVIEIAANKVLVADGGILQFNGEASAPITVTSVGGSDAAADRWGHVNLIDAGSGSRVRHTRFSHAGAFNNGTFAYYSDPDTLNRVYEGVLRLEGTSQPTVQDVTFAGVANWPIHQQFSTQPAYESVTWDGNPAVVNLQAGDLSDFGAARRLENGLIYRVNEQLNLINGQQLTLEAGTIVKFGAAGAIDLENSSITAQGTVDAPIILTSVCDTADGAGSYQDDDCSVPQAGDWGFVGLRGRSHANFAHVEIRFSGNPSAAAVTAYGDCTGCGHGAVMLTGSSALTPTLVLSNSLISQSAGYAVSTDIYASLTSVDSTVSDNAVDAVELRAADYSPFTAFAGRLSMTSLPYVIGPENRVMTLGSAISLTVDPGVMLRFAANSALNVNGAGLSMIGTAAAPITIASARANPVAGDWGHLRFYGTTAANARLHYVTVEHGGFYRGNAYETLCLTCEYDGSLLLDGEAVVELEHVTLRNGAGTAVSLDRGSYVTLGSTGVVTVTDNEIDGIEVRGSTIYSPAAARAIQWQVTGIPYLPADHVRFGNNAVLTIAPGVEIRMKPGKNLGFFGTGRLNAVGTADKPIIFSSASDTGTGSPAAGDWGHIAFLDGRSSNRIEHATIRYGGAYVSAGTDFYPNGGGYLSCSTCSVLNGPLVATVGSVTVKDVTFETNQGPAMVGDVSSQINISGTVRLLANDQNVILVRASSTDQSTQLPAVHGIFDAATVTVRAKNSQVETAASLVHRIAGDLTVANAGRLTLAAGAVLKFDLTAGLTVNSGGRLVLATDIPDVRTVLTSVRDDAVGGDTNLDGSASSAAAGNWDGVAIRSGAQFTVTRADIKYAATGLTVATSQSGAAISDLLISTNTNGIDASGAAGLNVRQSRFLTNTSVALRGPTSGAPLRATENYWNSTTGPRTSATESGSGGLLSGLVEFAPYFQDEAMTKVYSPFIYIPNVTR
jgi:hypothetical protein